MIKVLVPAFTAACLVGFINKDVIYEKYLQTQVNKSLIVEDGKTKFCSNTIQDNETPEQLVNRVKQQFNGASAFRQIIEIYETNLHDTDEIKALNEKITAWGWQDDEYIKEKIADYKKKSYMKDSLDELVALQEYRKSATHTKDELILERDNLRNALYLSKKQQLENEISKAISQFSCELSDESLNQEAAIILALLDRTASDEEKEKLEKMVEKRSIQGLKNASAPLESFTNKFYQLINDAVAEVKILDSETEVEDKSITNTLTVVSTNAFGKKQRFEIGCSANALGINPIFSSASMSKCFIRKPGESFGKSIYLYDHQIFVEEFDDENQWKKIKKEVLEKFE
ncbi:hypothetical protein [Vibrio rotiferianus]|uniref:hypothetical protein n=1 Tax=Vibrio rotiferianus TaxID=190895 RepID=UPI00390A63A2